MTQAAMASSMPLKVLGAYLRRLRKLKGWSQTQLVTKVNGAVGLRTVGRWENGDHEPYISELLPVVDALGGSIARATLLMVSETATEADAVRMAEHADSDLTEDELTFFATLSPVKRKLLRQFIEAEEADS